MAASSAFRKAVPLSKKIGLPERLKGGRIERWVNYWKGVANDYKEATLDLAKSSRERPIKAAIYSSIFVTSIYLNRTKCDENSFNDRYVRLHHDLTLVPDSQRNPGSEEHQARVIRCQNSGTLRFWNLGVATLAWQDNYDSKVGMFRSQCDYLKPTYKEIFTDRVIDVGFHGKWRIAKKVMKDYDINPNEWDKDGKPINPDSQLKPLI